MICIKYSYRYELIYALFIKRLLGGVVSLIVAVIYLLNWEFANFDVNEEYL
jgi:hypothetical protein